MARKRYTPEQIISKLRGIEVHFSARKTQAQAANREEISVHSYLRLREDMSSDRTVCMAAPKFADLHV